MLIPLLKICTINFQFYERIFYLNWFIISLASLRILISTCIFPKYFWNFFKTLILFLQTFFCSVKHVIAFARHIMYFSISPAILSPQSFPYSVSQSVLQISFLSRCEDSDASKILANKNTVISTPKKKVNNEVFLNVQNN